MSQYILVEAYACDLAHEVNHLLKQGYVPMGGPTSGREGIGSRKLIQAMYNASIPAVQEPELVLPTTRELEDAVFEANDKRPGSASSSPFAFATERERQQWDSDNEEIRNLLDSGSEVFDCLSEGKAESVLNAAKRIFHRKITHLRLLQQTPYMKHRVPVTNADRFEMIEEHMRIGDGVMEEYYAGERARDPYRVKTRPVIVLDLVDAQRIDSILESTRAQYPTEHQEAVNRFKRRVHGVQDEN